MEFRPLKSEDLMQYEELPRYVYMKMTGDTIIWGGFGEGTGELLGIVAFSPDPVERTRAVLEYVHVREAHRRSGIGSQLLKNMELKLRDNRLTGVYLKTITSDTDCKPVYDFFVKNEYVPTVFNGRLLEYKVQDLQTDELLNSFSVALHNKLKIEPFEKIDPIIRKRILAICWANKISVTERVINSEYSMIMNKAAMEGFLAVQRINDTLLYVWDAYIKNPKTRDVTFLSMLSASVNKLLSDGKLNPDGTVVISFSEIAIANNTIKYLGAPEQDKWQQEFNKLLRR